MKTYFCDVLVLSPPNLNNNVINENAKLINVLYLVSHTLTGEIIANKYNLDVISFN